MLVFAVFGKICDFERLDLRKRELYRESALIPRVWRRKRSRFCQNLKSWSDVKSPSYDDLRFLEQYAILSASPTETELYCESALIPQCALGSGLGSAKSSILSDLKSASYDDFCMFSFAVFGKICEFERLAYANRALPRKRFNTPVWPRNRRFWRNLKYDRI